jgi:excisionase family DNA binding protein
VTLQELLRELERRAEDAEAIQATAPAASVYRSVIEDLKGVEGPQNTPRERPDRFLTVREVAKRLNVAERYVYDHHHEWPFTRRLGRKLRFSEREVERWLGERR